MDSDTQTQQAQGATLVITGSFTLIFSVGLDLGQLSSSMSWPLLGVNSWYLLYFTLKSDSRSKTSAYSSFFSSQDYDCNPKKVQFQQLTNRIYDNN